jgi:Replication-relaxation
VDDVSKKTAPRRPRFRRAEPPDFRLTAGDLAIIRLVEQHRFLRSTHIAGLVGRSLDRTNDRLCRLFHAGYIDRPKAQLDHYPTNGSSPMVYALGDLGALLLSQRDGAGSGSRDWDRRNREAGRPFIDHQLEITEFLASLQMATQHRSDVRLIHPDELIAAFPEHTRNACNPFSLRVTLPGRGAEHEIGLIPDFAFGLRFADGSRRCFLVEIDRGTMPVSRSDLRQTSFQRKMHAYLAAYAGKQHESRFGWKAFRVLTVTTDDQRLRSMHEALRELNIPNGPGSALFFFATRDALQASDPLAYSWRDGNGNDVRLI